MVPRCCKFTLGIVLVVLLTTTETFKTDAHQVLMAHCILWTRVSAYAFWCFRRVVVT